MRLGFLLLFIISFNVVTGQQKQINLEEIWSGAFRTQGLDELRSLKNGKQYAVLNYNRLSGGSSVDVYDYITGKKSKYNCVFISNKGCELFLHIHT